MITTFIYSLVDPRDGRTRYIGKSNDPDERLRNHMQDKSHCHRANWIKSLMAAGLEPDLILLEECSQENWQERESYWITFLREQGADLVNSTDGGDGMSNPSEETRRKISNALRGCVRSIQTRQKMSEVKLGNKHGLGRVVSEEVRHSSSEKQIGKPKSDEARQRMSEAKKGKPGPKASEETRRKHSEHKKAWWTNWRISGGGNGK